MNTNTLLELALTKAFRELINTLDDTEASNLLSAVNSYKSAIMNSDAIAAYEATSSISKSHSIDWTASVLSLQLDSKKTESWVYRIIAQTEILRAYNVDQYSNDVECVIDSGHLPNECEYCTNKHSTIVSNSYDLPPYHPGCRCLVKRKTYINTPEEAPEGVEIQEGPRGGLYYELNAPIKTGSTNVQMQSGSYIPDSAIAPDTQIKMEFDSYRSSKISVGNVHGLPEDEGLAKSRVLVKKDMDDAQVEFMFASISNAIGWSYLSPPVYQVDNGVAMRWIDEYGSSSSTVNTLYEETSLPSENMVRDLTRMVVLDALTGNTDRHSGNVMIDHANDRVWAIDNNGAGSFGVEIPEQWNGNGVKDFASAFFEGELGHLFDTPGIGPDRWNEEIKRRNMNEWDASALRQRLFMNEYGTKKAISDVKKELIENRDKIVSALRNQANTVTLVGEDLHNPGGKIKLSDYLRRVADNFDRLIS